MSKEKLPLGEKGGISVVGGASGEDKERAGRFARARFGGEHGEGGGPAWELVNSHEIKKTTGELEMLRVANEISDEIMSSLGAAPFDIPERNVHILSRDNLTKLSSLISGEEASYMFYATTVDGIFAVRDEREGGNVNWAVTILHESLHAKGVSAFEVDKGGELWRRRSGWTTEPSSRKEGKIGPTAWFGGLHEAIMVELEKRHWHEVLERNKNLKNELEWLDSEECRRMKEAYAKEVKVPADEVFWIGKDAKLVLEFAYPRQRQVLNYVVDKIFEDGGFASREEIADIFFKAQFSGSLLPVGRLVEHSFGKGSMRELGEMDSIEDSSSVGRVLDYLMKRRQTGVGRKINLKK